MVEYWVNLFFFLSLDVASVHISVFQPLCNPSISKDINNKMYLKYYCKAYFSGIHLFYIMDAESPIINGANVSFPKCKHNIIC